MEFQENSNYNQTLWLGDYNIQYASDWGNIPYGAHEFRIEYDEEWASAGLPGYFVDRSRYRGDKMKNQRAVIDIPLPEPRVHVGGPVFNLKVITPKFFADVVFAFTFEEALTFIDKNSYKIRGFYGFHEMQNLRSARLRKEYDIKLEHEAEMKEVELEEETGVQLLSLFSE